MTYELANKPAEPKLTLAETIAKHQEYLKNPPADYTTERAAAIGAWAEKQRERVRERAKTDQSDELSRLIEKSAELVAADKHLEEKLGPQGSVKRNAETYSGKLADKPIFTDFAEASKEDQALVEKLDASIGSPKEGRRRVLSPERPNTETDRADRIAARTEKRVVWVENLGTDGVSVPAIPGIIFLDPGSKRSVQILATHELAHSLRRDNPTAFDQLVAVVRVALNPDRWAKFVVAEHKASDEQGATRLTPAQLREEYVVRLVSDYAYRAASESVRRMDDTRSVAFKADSSFV